MQGLEPSGTWGDGACPSSLRDTYKYNHPSAYFMMSGFRFLASTNQQDESSALSPFQFTSDSASGGQGGSRGDVSGTGGGSGWGSSATSGWEVPQNRRRRTAGSVSLMACTPCRQARQRVSIYKISTFLGNIHACISFVGIDEC